jgi:probable HAF family extracellular repeat protein
MFASIARWRWRNVLWRCLALGLTGALTACGGGGGGGEAGTGAAPGNGGGGGGGGAGTGAPQEVISSLGFSGTAATGAPIANAPIDIRCMSGSSSTRTDAAGRYQAAIASGALPCVARVTDSTGATLHSITVDEGTFNITSLTELAAANVAQEPPALFFNAFDLARAGRVSTQAISQAQANVRAQLPAVAIDPALDFIKTPFFADGQDRMDVILDALANAVDKPTFDRIRNTLSGVGGTDTRPPSVTLAIDTQNVMQQGAVTLTAAASDESGIEKVEFIENDVVLETVREAPYTARRSYAPQDNGSKRIAAKAYDKAGNAASSTAIIVAVNIAVAPPADTTAPSVALTVPQTTVTSAGEFIVTANATDNVGINKVEFYRGATLVGADSTAPYEFRNTLTSADNGNVIYTARAYDAAGNVATSQPVTVAINIAAPTWTIVDLGTLGGGFSIANGINDKGEVVGSSSIDSSNAVSHAFLYKDGQMKDLGAATSVANAINSSEQITGIGTQGSFLYQDGKLVTIGTPEYAARDINDSGAIVGTISSDSMGCFGCAFLFTNGSISNLGDFNPTAPHFARAEGINNTGQILVTRGLKLFIRSAVYFNGVLTDIGELTPGGLSPGGTVAHDINNNGQIVGRSGASAFLYSNGVMANIDNINTRAGTIEPYGINDLGRIVGNLQTTEGVSAFFYNGSAITYLNDLPEVKAAGWTLRSATAINNSGQIIGSGINRNGLTHAFLLTPPKAQ